MIASGIIRCSLYNKRYFSISKAIQKTADIKNVTIIGGGTMGGGICEMAARAGDNVTLADLNDASLKKARSTIEKNLKKYSSKKFKDDLSKGNKFVAETLSRISFVSDPHAAVKNADLVIEAIIEDVRIKQKLFSEIDKIAQKKCIFASNTSSYLVSEISSVVKRKDRFGGLHFFSPVTKMALVEVVKTATTSNETLTKLLEWVKSIKKTPVTCADSPGFIVNRLLIPYSLASIRLAEAGTASPQDIDTAMKLGAGFPMGPFDMMDLVGLDVMLLIYTGFSKGFPNDPSFQIPPVLKQMVKDGKLGRKSGQGWYKYDAHDKKI